MILLLLLVLLGAGLLFAFGFAAWVIYRRELASVRPVAESSVQKIFSPAGNLRAEIRNRPDGTFQVEIRRRRMEETDSGPSETWALVYGPAIVASMEEAADVANRQFENFVNE
jgi:hypothetical protein